MDKRLKQVLYQTLLTLIEIIAVLVILGILAAVAVPRFFDLQTEAALAATEGMAGGLSSASSLNWAAHLVGSTEAVSVGNCSAIGPLLEGGLPADYTITAAPVTEANSPVTCVLTGKKSQTANFLAHYVP